MDILEFLSQLNTIGIKIWQEGEQLRVSAPKGVLTPELQGQIVARKSEILAFLADAQTQDDVSLDPITPADRTKVMPLSMSQQEIWPLIQRNPNSSAFQMVVARRFKFDLDIGLLEITLGEVVRRHEILRTMFQQKDGRPVQVICPPNGFSLAVQDLGNIPAEVRERHLRQLLIEEAAHPLNPETGPLFRVLVYKMDESDYVLFQALHFLVTDCIGQAVLERETAQLYTSFANGKSAALLQLPFQYADFAIWQQRQVANGNLRSQLDYWAGSLSLPLPLLNGLGGRPLDAARSLKAERRSITLPETLTVALNELARRANSSLYMVLLAVFGVFLRAQSGQQDLLVGTPVAGRIHPGLDGLVGRFLNTLVLRLDLTGEPSFLELLERTRRIVLDGFSNQDAPFVQLIERLRQLPGGETLPDPLFSVQLNFAPLSDEAESDEPSAFGEELDLEQSEARYPLTLYINMVGEAIRLMLITQEGLFPVDQIDAFLAQLKTLLEGAAFNPEQPISRVLGENFQLPNVSTAEALPDECPVSIGDEPSGEEEIALLDFPAAATLDVDLERQARRKAVEQALVDIWKRLLQVEHVGVQDDFFALGGYSFLAMKMTLEVHEIFGVNIPLNTVFRNPRIEHIAASLEKQIGKTLWDSLVEIQPNGHKPPLYCVHGITGDTLWFEHLAHYLSPDQPIYGLQARGLDGVQPPQETIEEMAQLYIQEIRRHQPTGPYYIAGYSSGGNIAYEIACQLRQVGQEVGLLVVIDQPNPKSDYYTVRLGPTLLINILRNLPYRVQDFLHLRPERIVNRLANKLYYFLLDIKWALQHPGAGSRPLEIVELADYAPSLPAHIQKIIELGYSALVKYYPRSYPGKLTLIRAQGGRLLCSHDPKMGWGKWVDEVDIRVIPGAHWGLFQEPHIRDLSAMIQICLDESQTNDLQLPREPVS